MAMTLEEMELETAEFIPDREVMGGCYNPCYNPCWHPCYPCGPEFTLRVQVCIGVGIGL